jgi:hypothetical protein
MNIKTNPEPNEELLTRWIDDDLFGQELIDFEATIADDREMYDAMREEAKGLGNMMRANFASSVEPPYPDFFNSQIQKHIRDGMDEKLPEKASIGSQIWSWFRSPFTLAAAAAVALLLTFNRQQDESHTLVSSTFSPNPNVVATSFFSEDANATVIVLEGLDAIPDDREIVGKNIATYMPSGAPGFGKFFDDDNQLAFVMETNSFGAPVISSIKKDSI